MPKTNQQIAIEVIAGKWGNGRERVQKLTEAGYDPSAVQTIVNSLMENGPQPEIKTNVNLGTKNLVVDIDLSEYNSMTLNLHFGDDNV